MDIWERFCISYPSLLTIEKPIVEKIYGSRTLLLSRDTISMRIVIDLTLVMLGVRKIPCYWSLTQNNLIIPGEVGGGDGDLTDSQFVIVLYDIMEKYFLLNQ